MTRKKYPKTLDRAAIHEIFEDLDTYFDSQNKKVKVLTLGGVSIVLQEFRERSTNDIDLANTCDAETFLTTCTRLGIEAQIIAMSSTVDFATTKTVELYRGKSLTVRSVNALDLIKLKLERFRKQDPEDIYAIIEKANISFKQFCDLVREAKDDYIGRQEDYLLNARIVVEQVYANRAHEFDKLVS